MNSLLLGVRCFLFIVVGGLIGFFDGRKRKRGFKCE